MRRSAASLETAGVSPGLLRHHYGSKEALRKACDEYVFEMLHRINAQILEDPSSSADDRSRRQSASAGTWPELWPTGLPR